MIANVLSRSKTSDFNSEYERDEARIVPHCSYNLTGRQGLGSLPECPARRMAMPWRMKAQCWVTLRQMTSLSPFSPLPFLLCFPIPETSGLPGGWQGFQKWLGRGTAESPRWTNRCSLSLQGHGYGLRVTGNQALSVVMTVIDDNPGRQWRQSVSSTNTGGPYAMGTLITKLT